MSETEHATDSTPVIHANPEQSHHKPKKVQLQGTSWRGISALMVMGLFMLIGGYFLIQSFAATSTLTKSWATNADWTTNSTLSQVAVANNTVALAAASTVSYSPTTTTNIGLKKAVTASSSYSSGKGKRAVSYPARNINDGLASTRWASQSGGTQWVYLDLGANYDISAVKLNWTSDYAKSYQVQFSTNASTWSNAYTTSTGAGGVADLSGLSGSARYVRVNATVAATANGYSLWEFEVYGSQQATSGNVALGKAATASTVSADGSGINLPASNVTDGNTSSRWSSAYSDPQYVTVDLGASYNINEVKLNWETAYGSSYIIEVSPDNSTWTTIYRTTSGDGGVDDLTGLSGSGRYVRMYGSVRATSWGYSLWEFEVYAVQQGSVTYQPSGNITLTYDADAGTTSTAPVTWNSITPTSTLPAGTGVTYQARTSSDKTNWSSWLPVTGSLSGLSTSRYVQLQASLSTSNTGFTPVLNKLVLSYNVTVADPAPTVSLTASPTTVSSGGATTLTWNSTSATSCTSAGGWSGARALSGTYTTPPLTATSNFTLTCTGSGGSNTASATVTVTTASSTSGDAVPLGDYTNPATGQSWHQIFVDDFTVNAATGSWGTTDAARVVYTGDHGGKWNEYPDGWPSTLSGGKQGYNPATVLSVHDGTLDFFLHSVNGLPQGANPSPILPSGTVYQTYGRYTARIKVPTPSTTGDYHAAWLLWPQDESKWSLGGESDFPEMDLSSSSISAFHHYDYVNNQTQQEYFNAAADLSQWHTVTQEWGPTYVKYYLDGTLMGTATKNVYQNVERWQLQTEYSGHNSGQSGHLLVDWVAVYSKN